MSELEHVIEQIIDRKVAERFDALPRPKLQMTVDEETRQAIAQHEIIAHKSYLTKAEIAIYLGCSTRSVEDWAARPVSDNPLPVGYAGSDMRGSRAKIDQWVEREAQRKRLKLAS